MVNEKRYRKWRWCPLLFFVLFQKGFSQENIVLTKDQINFISTAPIKNVNDSLWYYYDNGGKLLYKLDEGPRKSNLKVNPNRVLK